MTQICRYKTISGFYSLLSIKNCSTTCDSQALMADNPDLLMIPFGLDHFYRPTNLLLEYGSRNLDGITDRGFSPVYSLEDAFSPPAVV